MTPEEEQEQLAMEMEMEREKAPGHSERLTDVGGVKRMEVHAVPKDVSEPEPAPERPGIVDQVGDVLHEVIGNPHTVPGAAAHGVAQGVTSGFHDELSGLRGASATRGEELQKIADLVEQAKRSGTYAPDTAPPIPGVTSYQLKRPGMPDQSVVREAKTANEPQEANLTPWTQAYTQARDSMRDRFKTAETEHKPAFIGGEVLGGIATPLPGTGKSRGLAKVAKYAGIGTGLGLASGLGNSEADLTKGEVGAAAGDTVKGGLGGAIAGGVLGAAASALDPFLASSAARRAYKALDPYMATISEGLGPDVASGKAPISEATAEMERLGKRALDEGIIPEGTFSRFADSEGINERAVSKLREAGELKGGYVDHAADELAKAGQQTPVSLGNLAAKLEQEAAQAKVDGNQKLARRLITEAREVRQTIVDRASAGFEDPAAQTLQEAEKFKTGKQAQVDYGRPLASREAQSAVARLAKEQAEKAIEGGLGPEELDTFKALKDRYGDLATLAKTSGHGAIRGLRNQTMGLGDKIAASAGAHAATGPMAVPAMLAAGALHHGANHRGSAALARTLANAAERTSPLVTPASSLEPWAQMLAEHEDKP